MELQDKINNIYSILGVVKETETVSAIISIINKTPKGFRLDMNMVAEEDGQIKHTYPVRETRAFKTFLEYRLKKLETLIEEFKVE